NRSIRTWRFASHGCYRRLTASSTLRNSKGFRAMSEFAHRRTSEVSKISHPETPGETTETSPAKRRNWTPPVEQMPPAIQFALSVVEWFRKKCTAVEKEKAP